MAETFQKLPDVREVIHPAGHVVAFDTQPERGLSPVWVRS